MSGGGSASLRWRRKSLERSQREMVEEVQARDTLDLADGEGSARARSCSPPRMILGVDEGPIGKRQGASKSVRS